MDASAGFLRCASCGKEQDSTTVAWHCDCGGYFDFLSSADAWNIDEDMEGMWRYLPMLPLHTSPRMLGEPRTPLLTVPWAGKNLLVKCEQLFPTGSFKDRGAAVMLNKCRELGIEEVIEDSSGNAGAAVAAYGAANGMHTSIFVPSSTSVAKQRQIAGYGATLHAIPGNRESAAQAALAAATHTYFASHCWSPWFVQGTQTFAFELYEQLGDAAPDMVVLPVGNGTLLLGAWLGFSRLKNLGLISTVPKLIAVQSATCAPLFHEFHKTPAHPTSASIAQGICVAKPLRHKQIIGAIRQSGGTVMQVDDATVQAAHAELLLRGISVEPTSAVVFAALKQWPRENDCGKSIVTAFTGHGLKSGV